MNRLRIRFSVFPDDVFEIIGRNRVIITRDVTIKGRIKDERFISGARIEGRLQILVTNAVGPFNDDRVGIRGRLGEFKFVEIDGVGLLSFVSFGIESEVFENDHVAVRRRTGCRARLNHVDLAQIRGRTGFEIEDAVVRFVSVFLENAVTGHTLQDSEGVNIRRLTGRLIVGNEIIRFRQSIPLDRHAFDFARFGIRHVDGGIVFRILRGVCRIVVVSPESQGRLFRRKREINVLSGEIRAIVNSDGDAVVIVKIFGRNAVERRRNIGRKDFLHVARISLPLAGRGRIQSAVQVVRQNLRVSGLILIDILVGAPHEPRVSVKNRSRSVREGIRDIIEGLLFQRIGRLGIDDLGVVAPSCVCQEIGESRGPSLVVMSEAIGVRGGDIAANDVGAVGSEGRVRQIDGINGDARGRGDVSDRRRIVAKRAQQSRVGGEELTFFERFHPETSSG